MKTYKTILFVLMICLSALPSAAFGQQRRSAGQGVPDSNPTDRDRKRDEWQRPAEVLDALGVKPGQRVADIGSGSGYFTFHLAARVGAEGKVYAIDIDEAAVNKVRQRAEREKLPQIEPILGESADPHLPNDLDSVLIVDTYHEFREYDQTMQAVLRALKPGGRLALIDGAGPAGRPRTEYHRLHVIPAELVREEVTRNGFAFKESLPGFYDAEYGKQMYFLIFEKPIPRLKATAPANDLFEDARAPAAQAQALRTPVRSRSNNRDRAAGANFVCNLNRSTNWAAEYGRSKGCWS